MVVSIYLFWTLSDVANIVFVCKMRDIIYMVIESKPGNDVQIYMHAHNIVSVCTISVYLTRSMAIILSPCKKIHF